jgi:hypothetical protein
MIRKMTVGLSVIAIGLILSGCPDRTAQLTPEEKKYADDTSFCRASTKDVPEQPEAFAVCMATRGWRERVPQPSPRPRRAPYP